MRLALAGTGSLAQDLLLAVQQTENVEVTAIYHHSPDPDAANKLAESYGIQEVYDDYSRMVRLAKADFVYIALVNDAHFEYAKEALEHGLNVIVEKPMCPTAKEVRLLADLAWEKELFLFEAVTTLHTQNYRSLRDMVKQLGSIRMVLCNFSQRSSRYDRYWSGLVAPAFAPEHYGGALHDINVYNINFVVDLFGAPDDVGYYANLGYNGIDLSGTVILQYPYFHAVCTGAKDSTSPGYLIVQGDKGYVKLDGNPNSAPKLEMNISGRSGVFRLNRYEHRMIHELLDFDQTWRQRNLTRAKYWLETSIAVADTVERAAASAGLVYGVQNDSFPEEEPEMVSDTVQLRADDIDAEAGWSQDTGTTSGKAEGNDGKDTVSGWADDRGTASGKSGDAASSVGYGTGGDGDDRMGAGHGNYDSPAVDDFEDEVTDEEDYQDIERLPLADGYSDIDVDSGTDDFMDLQDIPDYP